MARGSWDGWNRSWETYVQGVALVAGEDLPNALRHALGAPQLGLFTRPLSCGKLRPRQHLLLLCRHHGTESRLSRALTPSRRRRRRAESLLASRFLTRRLAAAPHCARSLSFQRLSQLCREFGDAAVMLVKVTRRFVNALAFYNLLDQIMWSVGPSPGGNPAPRTRASFANLGDFIHLS